MNTEWDCIGSFWSSHFPRVNKSVCSSLDSQRPTYPDVVPKMRPSIPNMGHVGPGISLVDENPCYEPAESYGTTTGI